MTHGSDICRSRKSLLLNLLLGDFDNFRLLRSVGCYGSSGLILLASGSSFRSSFVLCSFLSRSGFRCFPGSRSGMILFRGGSDVVESVLDGFRRGSESVDEGNGDGGGDENPREIGFGRHN